jgi:adenosine kinase
MRIFVSGSLAYDRIMNFPGHFADHILPEKIHVLNVCFNIDSLVEKFGGTAGNIAYTLALLGEKPYIVATAGDDFDRYEYWLQKHQLPNRWIKKISGVFTAGAYITTDLDDNQITAFNPGAMDHKADLPDLDAGDAVAFIAPGNKLDMMEIAERSRKSGTPFFFDPGQSLNTWDSPELREAALGALCFISNDYESSQFLQMTRWSMDELTNKVGIVITTCGPEGVLLHMNGQRILIPAVKADKIVDPTGAGDAFRAGLLKAWSMKFPWDIACQVGVVVASFAIEHYGTQEHRIGWNDLCRRYEENFGPLIC